MHLVIVLYQSYISEFANSVREYRVLSKETLGHLMESGNVISRVQSQIIQGENVLDK